MGLPTVLGPSGKLCPKRSSSCPFPPGEMTPDISSQLYFQKTSVISLWGEVGTEEGKQDKMDIVLITCFHLDTRVQKLWFLPSPPLYLQICIALPRVQSTL